MFSSCVSCNARYIPTLALRHMSRAVRRGCRKCLIPITSAFQHACVETNQISRHRLSAQVALYSSESTLTKSGSLGPIVNGDLHRVCECFGISFGHHQPGGGQDLRNRT